MPSQSPAREYCCTFFLHTQIPSSFVENMRLRPGLRVKWTKFSVVALDRVKNEFRNLCSEIYTFD